MKSHGPAPIERLSAVECVGGAVTVLGSDETNVLLKSFKQLIVLFVIITVNSSCTAHVHGCLWNPAAVPIVLVRDKEIVY